MITCLAGQPEPETQRSRSLGREVGLASQELQGGSVDQTPQVLNSRPQAPGFLSHEAPKWMTVKRCSECSRVLVRILYMNRTD